MKSFSKIVYPLALILALFACEEENGEDETILPLSGNYDLLEMSIEEMYVSQRDTTLTLLAEYNGSSSYQLPAGTALGSQLTEYSSTDSVPIDGLVELNNDGSARLGGHLPVNWGTGCVPFVLISELASDGSWAADMTTGTFDIDLVVDALDIQGSFSIVGDLLEIRYTLTDEAAQTMISSIPVMDGHVDTELTCMAVTTVTDRVLTLRIQE